MSSFSVGTSAARQIALVVYSVCTLVYWFSLRRLWVWHHRQPHLSLFVVLFMVVTVLALKVIQYITLHLSVLCLCHRRLVFLGWRIIGKDTNYSAMHTTHTLFNMSPHSNNQNWVRGSALFFLPFSLNFLVAPPWLASTMSMHSGLMDARPFLFLSQDGLCGVDTLGSPYLPIMHSAVHAHSCFH